MVLIAQVTAPDEGLVFSTNNIRLKIGQKVIDNGTLYISPDALAWQPENLPEGISIHWKQISVHGVSQLPSKCIYFILDHKLVWRGVYEGDAMPANGMNGDGADDEDDEGNVTDEEDQMTECWLIPDDANTVDTMFQAMFDCQALHPDSNDSLSSEGDVMEDDDDDEASLGDNENAETEEASEGMQNLTLDDERFADAD